MIRKMNRPRCNIGAVRKITDGVYPSVYCFLFIFLLISPVSADCEFWSTDTFQFSGPGINIIPEIRVKNGLSDLYYFQTYIGPSRNLSKNLKMNIYYGYKLAKSSNNWAQSNLGYFDLIYAFEPFSNRFRFEGDFTNGVSKYRNDLKGKMGNFYLADEFFYNFPRNYIDENRLTGGYVWKFNASREVNFGYMLRSQKASAGAAWSNSNAIIANGSIKI